MEYKEFEKKYTDIVFQRKELGREYAINYLYEAQFDAIFTREIIKQNAICQI